MCKSRQINYGSFQYPHFTFFHIPYLLFKSVPRPSSKIDVPVIRAMSRKRYVVSIVVDIASKIEYQSIIEYHSLSKSMVIIAGFYKNPLEIIDFIIHYL